MSTGPACRLHMTHLVGSGGHRGPRALLGHLAPAAHLRASPIGCAQLVTWDISPCQKWQLATFLPTSCWLPSFPRMDVSSSGPHSFKLLGPLLLMTIRSYGLRLHPPAQRRAFARRNQSHSVLLLAAPGHRRPNKPSPSCSWPAHRRLRPAGGRPPPALIVVRPCTWPMGHDGLSPSCRAKSIVAVMTLWQTVILSPKQRIRACLRETVLSPTSCRLWAVWAGPDVPTTLGLHPPATKPIQGGNFWTGRRKGAEGGSTVNRGQRTT